MREKTRSPQRERHRRDGRNAERCRARIRHERGRFRALARRISPRCCRSLRGIRNRAFGRRCRIRSRVAIFSSTLALTGFAERPLLREGAAIGDAIFVTGTLGGSILKNISIFVRALPRGVFSPRFPRERCTPGIDVTDGLLKDHAALLPAGTHAEFDFGALPVSDDARTLGGNLLQRAFCDGEDYELLFAVAGTQAEHFEKFGGNASPMCRFRASQKSPPAAKIPR